MSGPRWKSASASSAPASLRVCPSSAPSSPSREVQSPGTRQPSIAFRRARASGLSTRVTSRSRARSLEHGRRIWTTRQVGRAMRTALGTWKWDCRALPANKRRCRWRMASSAYRSCPTHQRGRRLVLEASTWMLQPTTRIRYAGRGSHLLREDEGESGLVHMLFTGSLFIWDGSAGRQVWLTIDMGAGITAFSSRICNRTYRILKHCLSPPSCRRLDFLTSPIYTVT